MPPWAMLLILLGIAALLFGLVTVLNRIKWPFGWLFLFGFFIAASAVGYYRQLPIGP